MTAEPTNPDDVEVITYSEPVVPAGKDPLDDLTVQELDIASRQLKCDVYEAVGGKAGTEAGGLRWAALARVAWLWAKRTDPRAKLTPFLMLGADDLSKLLRLAEATEAAREAARTEDDENPTD